MSQFYDQDGGVPPVPPAPKQGAPRWLYAVLIGLAVVIAVSLGYSLSARAGTAPKDTPSPTSSSFTQTGSPVPAFTDEELGLGGYDEPAAIDVCLDLREQKRAAVAAQRSYAQFEAARDRADIPGMSRGLHDTADHLRDAAFAANADLDISDALYRAADLYDEAADLLKSAWATLDTSKARAAGRKVGFAESAMFDATRELKHSKVPAC